MSESRNQEQEKVLFIVYQSLFLMRMGKSFEIVPLIETTLDTPYDEVSLFIRETSIKVLSHVSDLEKEIREYCTTWKFERINLLVIAVLMMAIGEYRYVGDVDKAIVIDVAVKLAKKYCGEKDYKFINAVLDRALD